MLNPIFSQLSDTFFVYLYHTTVAHFGHISEDESYNGLLLTVAQQLEEEYGEDFLFIHPNNDDPELQIPIELELVPNPEHVELPYPYFAEIMGNPNGIANPVNPFEDPPTDEEDFPNGNPASPNPEMED